MKPLNHDKTVLVYNLNEKYLSTDYLVYSRGNCHKIQYFFNPSIFHLNTS